MQVTAEEVKNQERSTTKQVKSKLWYRHPSGCVTSSKIQGVCPSSTFKLFKSLIKSIVFPPAHQFSNKATKWGLENEKNAF